MSFCKPGIHPKIANVAFWGIFVSWELRTFGQYLFQLMQFQLDGTPKQNLLFWLARYQNQNLQKRAKQHFVFFSTSATCNLFGFNNRELAGGRNFIKRRRWWNKSQIREEPLWLELSSEQTPRKLLCLSPASSVSVSKRTTWWPFLKRGHGKLRGYVVTRTKKWDHVTT